MNMHIKMIAMPTFRSKSKS